MKLLLSARIHTPKPRITAPRTWKEKGAVSGGPLPAAPAAWLGGHRGAACILVQPRDVRVASGPAPQVQPTPATQAAGP